jgi:hypothetical protein
LIVVQEFEASESGPHDSGFCAGGRIAYGSYDSGAGAASMYPNLPEQGFSEAHGA